MVTFLLGQTKEVLYRLTKKFKAQNAQSSGLSHWAWTCCFSVSPVHHRRELCVEFAWTTACLPFWKSPQFEQNKQQHRSQGHSVWAQHQQSEKKTDHATAPGVGVGHIYKYPSKNVFCKSLILCQHVFAIAWIRAAQSFTEIRIAILMVSQSKLQILHILIPKCCLKTCLHCHVLKQL